MPGNIVYQLIAAKILLQSQ